MTLKEKFNIIKHLEKWRWEQEEKEYSFEHSFYCFKNNIKFDEKNKKFVIDNKNLAEKILLTHYLLYICDRQMDYRHIFKAGGYVVSRLVEEYMLQPKPELNWNEIFKICRIKGNGNYSYFLCAPIKETNGSSGEIYDYFLKREKIINKDGQVINRSKSKKKNNNTENKSYELFFNAESDEYAIFSSRYMLQDIGCMYKTLKYLNDEYLNKDEMNEKIQQLIKNQKYKGSFSAFLKSHSDCICDHEPQKLKDGEKKIRIKKETEGLARALFELTYQCIPQITASDIDIDEINDKKLAFDVIINTILDKMGSKFDPTNSNLSLEANRHSLKRKWCIIRDFLRHPVFRECYKLIIGEEKFNYLYSKEQHKIELPGDVWNNNSTFARCFWGDNKNATKSSGFVRNMYDNRENESWGECLPIDFDITFNFVPRMCEEDKCEICPLAQYSEIENKKKYINWQEKICHENIEGKWCPLSLYSCGIKHRCDSQCPFRTTPKL